MHTPPRGKYNFRRLHRLLHVYVVQIGRIFSGSAPKTSSTIRVVVHPSGEDRKQLPRLAISNVMCLCGSQKTRLAVGMRRLQVDATGSCCTDSWPVLPRGMDSTLPPQRDYAGKRPTFRIANNELDNRLRDNVERSTEREDGSSQSCQQGNDYDSSSRCSSFTASATNGRILSMSSSSVWMWSLIEFNFSIAFFR